ncbi:hypothetical protein GIB67_001321 [Kingdonia uniflora]|uniref:RNase H type-1 domain-containing protein n=1 Tax=Kingdonia uniflora TaxID=39325 RepID=A0A7J7LL61_9MAGN|nr:hypothetical protein GIB67_001321 [Kingdonia uniflora]
MSQTTSKSGNHAELDECSFRVESRSSEVEASANQVAEKQMLVYQLPSKILCRIIDVQLKAEADTDELENEVGNDDIVREVSKANQLLTTAINNDEELWKQKACVNWLQSGDRNISYFNALARIKRNKSLIHAIQTEDGVRGAIEDVRTHSGWVIGDGASIDLWRDNWCSLIFLKDWINNDCIPWKDLHAKDWGNLGRYKSALQARNNCIYEDQINTLANEKRKWIKQIHDTAVLSSGFMFNNQSDLGILHCLGVAVHPCNHPMVKSCFWELPQKGEIKINTDGAARGNPGKGAYSWIESDFTTAVEAFKSNNIPWVLEAAWENARRNMKHIRISANWKEANFSADALSKRGANLHEGSYGEYYGDGDETNEILSFKQKYNIPQDVRLGKYYGDMINQEISMDGILVHQEQIKKYLKLPLRANHKNFFNFFEVTPDRESSTGWEAIILGRAELSQRSLDI